MFVFGKEIGKKYKQLIKGEFKVIGSFRNNIYKVNKKKKFDIFYISTWRDRKFSKQLSRSQEIWKKIIYEMQAKLVKFIFLYSKKNNKKLSIYGSRAFTQSEKRNYFIKKF